MATRKRRNAAGTAVSSASLPDLTPSMSVSAISQLPAAALKQYAELYQLPSGGNKKVLAQRLHTHLHPPSSSSDESENSSHTSSSDSNSGMDDNNRHTRRSSSSPEGERPPSRRRQPSRRDCTLLSRESVPRMNTQPHANHSTTNDNNICRIYNKRAFCFRGAKCQYLHICSACRGGHPRRACPKQVQ